MLRTLLLLLLFPGFCVPRVSSIPMCDLPPSNTDSDPECNNGVYTEDKSPFADPLYMHNCTGSMRLRRTQGYKRPSRCVPGPVEGTCIIPVYEKKSLAQAAESCLFEYGGRLAVAKDTNTNSLWLQTIWRDPNYLGEVANQPTRFWLGAFVGKYGSDSTFFTITDFRTLRFLPDEQWNSTLKDFESLESSFWPMTGDRVTYKPNQSKNCPSWGVALDVSPNDGKWHELSASERHGYLCEAPRWPKLDCGTGWALMPAIRTCVKPVKGSFLFKDCIQECAKIGGMLAAESAPSRYYYKDVIEPMYKETRRQGYIGAHLNNRCSKGRDPYTGRRMYAKDNLDGSVNGYVSAYKTARTGTAACNNVDRLIVVRGCDTTKLLNCFCQKVVDISAAEITFN